MLKLLFAVLDIYRVTKFRNFKSWRDSSVRGHHTRIPREIIGTKINIVPAQVDKNAR